MRAPVRLYPVPGQAVLVLIGFLLGLGVALLAVGGIAFTVFWLAGDINQCR